MYKTALFIVAALAAGSIASVTPAAANGCGPKKCYSITQKAYDVPDVSRIGIFIGHFDSNGTPHSIVTPGETTVDEVPCPPNQMNNYPI